MFIDNFGNGPRSTPAFDNGRAFVLASRGKISAVDTDAGEILWTVSLADSFDIKVPERGRLAIIEATADGYHELAYAQALEGKSWTSPTFVGGKIYLRNRKEMACYDLTN